MLKKIVTILNICMIVLPVLFGSINVIANNESFDMVRLSQSEQKQIWNNISIQKIENVFQSLSEFSSPIVSFDVCKNKNIVLGLKDNRILIINDNGNILNSYKFENDGTYYIQWKEENLLLFLTRGSIIVEFSQNGELISMVEADEHSVKNNNLWNQLIRKKSVSIENYDYQMKNNIGILNLFTFQTYSQLIKTDSDGNVTVIYNVNSNQMIKAIIILVIILLVILSVFVVIIKTKLYQAKKHKEKK